MDKVPCGSGQSLSVFGTEDSGSNPDGTTWACSLVWSKRFAHNELTPSSNLGRPIEGFKFIANRVRNGLDGIPWLTESMTLSGSSNLPKSFGNGDVQANSGLERASRRKSGAKYESFTIPISHGYGR